MESGTIHNSTFTFDYLVGWDHQVHGQATAFKIRYGVYPNILLASSGTYSRIDMVVNARGREKLYNPQGENPPAESFISMNGFKGPGYELDFCVEEQLGLDTIKLIYDSDPGGGEPLPEEKETANAV